jgi:DNA polymerase-1
MLHDLEEKNMTKLYEEMEQPLSMILAQMELDGIYCDISVLKTLGDEFKTRLTDYTQRIYDLAEHEFNINSPKQLGVVLFEELQLPPVKKTKTGYSTSVDVLEKLAPYHEIIELILQYRSLAKLVSTYVEGLSKEIRPSDHKVHTYYRQTVTATGRLSSTFPNLQNIPIRMDEGRIIRRAFLPSLEDSVILSSDYSQIELRVLAHISGDKNLREAFLHDMDIHTKTAMDVFGVPEDQVDSNMRRQAKAVNFGIVYGISDFGLGNNLGISRKEAGQFIEQYLHVFSGVKEFMANIVVEARAQGYVTTLLERRRYLPDITSRNFNLRSFAERTAMNTPIQGTAADLIKLAMIKMEQELHARKLQSRMLLQVHDELVFEVPRAELDTMQVLVPEVMENIYPTLSVPLRVETNYGPSWYDAK